MVNDNNIENDDLIGKKVEEEIKQELKEEEKKKEIYDDAYIKTDISMVVSLGKLVKTLGEICPECGKTHLQLRSRQNLTVELGDDVIEDELYRWCFSCEIEFDFEEKRVRKKRDRANREIEPENKREGRNQNARYQKPSSTQSNFGKDRSRGNRGSGRTGFEKGSRKY